MDDNATDSGPPEPRGNTLAVAWLRIWRYRLLVMLTVVIGSGVGLFFSLTVPNQYQSVGKLYVRPGLRDLITPEAALSDSGGSTYRGAGSREAVLNELQVLSGSKLYDKVVQDVGVELLLAPYDPASESEATSGFTRLSHSFQSWWFASGGNKAVDQDISREKAASLLLQGGVSISAESGTSVIACSYVAHSPETANKVVNAVLKAAREVHQEVFETMSPLLAIEDEMKSSEASARAAETALREFRVEKAIHSFDSEYASVLSYVDELNRLADTTELEIGRKQAERNVFMDLEKLRAGEKTTRAGDSFVVNPSYSGLVSLLTQLQLRALSLEEQQGEMTTDEYQRRKVALAKSIVQAQSRIMTEGKQLKVEGTADDNPRYLRIAQSLDELNVEVKSLESKKVKTEALRAKTLARLSDLDKLSPKLRALELDAKQKRERADGLIGSVTKMKTVQRLERLSSSSVQIMHGGTLEPQKIAPRRGRMVFFGAFGGAALGVVLGLLLAFRDPKVRCRDDLTPLGFQVDDVLHSGRGDQPAKDSSGGLSSALEGIREDVARFWASIPYERGASDGLKVAFVPSDTQADAGRAAATFAIGLATHACERVVYVSCVDGESWLARNMGVESVVGWSDVLGGDKELASALVSTPVSGLTYLPFGSRVDVFPHPMAGLGFGSLLEDLATKFRFVIVELPDLDAVPEARVVLSVADAVELVVRNGVSKKDNISKAVDAVRLSGARMLGAVLQDTD